MVLNNERWRSPEPSRLTEYDLESQRKEQKCERVIPKDCKKPFCSEHTSHRDFRENGLSVQKRDFYMVEFDNEISVCSFVSFALFLMKCLHVSWKEFKWTIEDSAISFLVCERSSKTERTPVKHVREHRLQFGMFKWASVSVKFPLCVTWGRCNFL